MSDGVRASARVGLGRWLALGNTQGRCQGTEASRRRGPAPATLSPLYNALWPGAPSAQFTSTKTASISARAEIKSVDAVHFLKQHISSG